MIGVGVGLPSVAVRRVAGGEAPLTGTPADLFRVAGSKGALLMPGAPGSAFQGTTADGAAATADGHSVRRIVDLSGLGGTGGVQPTLANQPTLDDTFGGLVLEYDSGDTLGPIVLASPIDPRMEDVTLAAVVGYVADASVLALSDDQPDARLAITLRGAGRVTVIGDDDTTATLTDFVPLIDVAVSAAVIVMQWDSSASSGNAVLRSYTTVDPPELRQTSTITTTLGSAFPVGTLSRVHLGGNLGLNGAAATRAGAALVLNRLLTAQEEADVVAHFAGLARGA